MLVVAGDPAPADASPGQHGTVEDDEDPSTP
jgi:hypothetical protein